MWLLEAAVLFLVITTVAGTKPSFQCQEVYPGSTPETDCAGSHLYQNMKDEKILETEAGTWLYKLEAYDADGDTVTFAIDTYLGTPEDFDADGLEFLEVNATSGDVLSKKAIDYETIHRLGIKWKLTDSNGDDFMEDVFVYVGNRNDNDPKFSSIRYQTDAIPENSQTPKDVIYTVSATDVDSTEGIEYSIIPAYTDWPCNGDIFEIGSQSGNITLMDDQKLDFEVSTLYTICVQVTDSGEPKADGDMERMDYAQVIVAIQDAQDTAPVFTLSNYNREVKEDAALGSEVVQVQAKEGDRGVLVPNEIIYTLTGGDGKFDIENKTGKIIIKELLDRETNSSHTVRVKAQEITGDGSDEAEPSSNQVNITFQVADVDDELPRFSSDRKYIVLQENSLLGSFVNLDELSVSDNDQAPNNEIHLSLGGPDADAFRIQSVVIFSEGVVDVRVRDNTKLDYEKTTKLEFEIYAKDKGDIVYDTAYINVTLEDQNDETPVFTKGSYSFEIEENSKGVFVGIMNATDADSAPFNNITYALFGQGDEPQFQMDDSTGEIRVREDARLDREGQNVYIFTCVASDGQRSVTEIVEIDLLDANDISPVFTASEYAVQVEESSVPDGPIRTVSANDADKDEPNNAITYSLSSSVMSKRFSIDNMTGEIILIEALDYEVDDPEFTLTVIATDGGEPALMANATILVTIQDVNDNSPVFTQDVYLGNVYEDTNRGKRVLTVEAADADKQGSVNSRIDYFFVDDAVSDFRIGVSTGQVTVNSANLDRDEMASYALDVIAIDRGEPERNGTCLVEITLLDVNNKPPTFDEAQPTESIYENATSGSLVATVYASDPDETAHLVYSITEGIRASKPDETNFEGNLSGIFHMNSSTGEIFTSGQSLNREEISTFFIPIMVNDTNTETGSYTAEATLTLVILDVNDNAPQFTGNDYSFDVMENTPVGAVISTSIKATDADEGPNGKITFELVDDFAFLMAIDSNGDLTVNGTFDREEYDTYSVLVVARDNGHPQLSSNRTIQISIGDVNDNGPYYNESLIRTVDVLENYTSEADILQVMAQDDDGTDEFSSIAYTITGGDPSQIFSINSTTGWIVIKEGEELDRENVATHILTVSASDTGGRQDTTQVTINVLDVNDNAPEFPIGSREIRIPESVEVNHLVTTVTATDQDEAGTDNAKVVYNITAGNDAGLFNIATVNQEGLVRTTTSLSNRVGDYDLRITASDQGKPTQRSYPPFNLTVKVTDVNDDTPEITYPQNLQDIQIPENYTGFVLYVDAVDTDQGDNGVIDFSFIQSVGPDGRDDEYFNITKIDEGRAEISIRETTDRETKAIYYLEVRVEDRGEFHLRASVSFTVSVNDSDDNDPVFWTKPEDRETAFFNVPENEDAASIGSVDQATDADEAQNQEFNYFIVDGNGGDQFVLEQKTGELSLKKALDRELSQTFSLVVKVESDGVHPQSDPIPYNGQDNTLLQVNITVLDINDNPPVFKETLYTGGAKYSAEFNSEVIMVEAIDSDIGDNAVVVYKLLSEEYSSTDGEESIPTENFEVVADTGSIRTKRNFEKQDAGYFTLQVQAVDSLESTFTDEVTVSIYLYSEEQQVKMTIYKTTDEVRGYMDGFQKLIEDIIVEYGVISSSPIAKRAANGIDPAFVLDELQVLTRDNQPVIGWSVMKFHVVNRLDNTIIAPSVIVNAIDDAYEYIETLRSVYGVDEIEIAVPPPIPPPTLDWVQWLLLAFLCVSVVFVIGLVATYCIMSSSYKRKLRAATAGVYESKHPTSITANLAPNTNKFTEPGSNPVYGTKVNAGFENDYSEVVDTAETAEEHSKAELVKNGHAARPAMSGDPRSEEQELVLEMYDDSADHEQVADEDLGDHLIMQLLQDVDRNRMSSSPGVHLPGFANLTITEI